MQLIFTLILCPATIKTRMEINETENSKIEKLNEDQISLFEEINQIDKLLD